MEYTFNPNEILFNGIGGAGYRQAVKSYGLALETVNRVREDLGLDRIWSMVQEANGGGYPLYWGTRFADGESVTYRLLTALGGWAAGLTGSDGDEVATIVREVLAGLTPADATTLVVSAHVDCAQADHWYLYGIAE